MKVRVLIPAGALAAASAWCVLLLAVRRHAYGEVTYGYLVGNLALAWIPLVLAALLLVAYLHRRPAFELLAIGAAWLLFLPNAPYVLTDFVHLDGPHRLFDTVVLSSFALTALVLGFASLLLVQLVVTRAAGALLGWLTVVGSLSAASVGVYLGRVGRFNSWDVVDRPRRLAGAARIRLDDPFGNRYLIAFTVGLSVLLVLAYVGLYGFTAATGGRRDREPLLGSGPR